MSMPTCRELMTREPVCCEPTDAVTRVAELMKREDIGSVPVVESLSSRRLVGIVTDRDLVTKVVAGGQIVEQATVRDAMTFNPASCREDDDVSHAVSLMAERQVRRMPVVDDQGRVIGIIAQADVATRIGRDSDTGHMVESISEPPIQR
jgi:CBS domain-containing protein